MRKPNPCLGKWCVPIVLVVALLGGCSSTGDDGAEPIPPVTGAELGTKNFLQFLNRQPALAAGDYTLVAATKAPGQSGSYRIDLSFDDGSTRVIDGNWTASGGSDPAAPGNPRHAITLDRPGGLQATLSSQTDALLLLLDTRTGHVIPREVGDVDSTDTRIAMPESTTDAAAYARAYYATIDPLNRRTTLADWKRVNGFDAGEDAAVVFRDTRDLGYGRNMHMKTNAAGGVAIYVDNYQLVDVAGVNYSAVDPDINLDAAIDQTQQFYLGTNTLEFGPVDGDGVAGGQDFVRFYAFSPQPPFDRLLALDMDGLGEKGMPVPCITCHGGRADPVLPDGRFPRHGDAQGHLQPIDVDEMDFSSRAGFSRAAFEAGFKAINQAVYKSYESSPTGRTGEWASTSARELIEAWYGGVNLPNPTFVDEYVPAGWRPNPISGFPPAGADALYRDVVSDNCRACHLLRGTFEQSDIDFSVFAKFISYRDRIEPLVYDSGQMPLGLIAYGTLFDHPVLLDQLAGFLPGFSRRNAQGAILRPGRAIANAGPDRHSIGPVAVSGSASRAAQSYSWRIVGQPSGANATLTSADHVRALLHGDVDGTYDLELTVTGADGELAEPAMTHVTLDSSLSASSDPPAPAEITFDNHIMELLKNNCFSCHGTNPDVRPDLLMTPPVPPEVRDVYTDVRARVNFDDPEQSPLLTKPLGVHHNGGRIPGFDRSGDRRNHDLLLEWILEGVRQR